MATATERFTGRAESYERYRSRYPAAEVLAVLGAWCSLTPSQTVADIGAGTGMLSRIFLENGNHVIAVEPNDEMREAALPLAQQFTNLTLCNATAEATTLPSHSVDLIAAGRAFHWFDHARAIPEFHRILRPDGWIALISAGRAKDGSQQARDYEQLLHDRGTDYSYVRGGYRVHEHLEELFPGSEIQQKQLRGEQFLTLEEFVGQTLSLSVAPLPDDPGYPAMLQALEDFFQQYATDGHIRIATTCWITCIHPAA